MICKKCHKRYTPIEEPLKPEFYGFCKDCGTMCIYCQLLIGYWLGVATAMFTWLFVALSSLGGWPVLISTLAGTSLAFFLLSFGIRKSKPRYFAYPKTYKRAKSITRFFGGFIGALAIMICLFISYDFFKSRL